MRAHEFIPIDQYLIQDFHSMRHMKGWEDAFILYLFYYSTALRQKTNQPKALFCFTKKWTGWSKGRIYRANKILSSMGLIEIIRKTDKRGYFLRGQVFIRLKFKWRGKSTVPFFQSTEKGEIKCLQSNIVSKDTIFNKKCLQSDSISSNLPREGIPLALSDIKDIKEKIRGYKRYKSENTRELSPIVPSLAKGGRAKLADLNSIADNVKAARRCIVKLKSSSGIVGQMDFWAACMLVHGYTSAFSFTSQERGMLRNLGKQLSEINVPVTRFIEYCIENWEIIRRRKKISQEVPTFKQCFFIKEDIIFMMKEPSHVAGKAKKARKQKVITRIEDVPSDHPQYKTLVSILKKTGKVTVL